MLLRACTILTQVHLSNMRRTKIQNLFKKELRIKLHGGYGASDETSEETSNPSDVLNYLCEQSGANYAEVSVVDETLFGPFLKQVILPLCLFLF